MQARATGCARWADGFFMNQIKVVVSRGSMIPWEPLTRRFTEREPRCGLFTKTNADKYFLDGFALE